MAKTIPQLTDATTVNAADELIIQQGGVTKRATATELFSGTATVTATGSTTGRPLKDRFADVVNVKDFGAVGDGVANDTAAFMAAANASRAVYVPAGTYSINNTINITQSGANWYGDGSFATVISSSSTSLPMFSIGASVSGAKIQDMTLTRSVTAISGGDGITSIANSVNYVTLSNLLIEKQFNGVSLGVTAWSEVNRVVCERCVNDGFYITNNGLNGSCQWSFDTCLAQFNGSRGFFVQSVAGASQISVGTLKNCATFANSGIGVAFVGLSGTPIQGVRIHGGFFGEDGNHEVFLDTYGKQHTIANVFAELAGRGLTGALYNTPASNVGCGFAVTQNNEDVQLTGVHCNGNSFEGFLLDGQEHILGNCRSTNNGLAGLVNRRAGARSTQGGSRIIISGGRFGNSTGSSSQQYGVFAQNGANVSIGFADLTNNAISAWAANASVLYVTSVGNLPNTLDVGLAPNASVLVGGDAVGGFIGSGTINVGGGLLKNNTAYNNP